MSSGKYRKSTLLESKIISFYPFLSDCFWTKPLCKDVSSNNIVTLKFHLLSFSFWKAKTSRKKREEPRVSTAQEVLRRARTLCSNETYPDRKGFPGSSIYNSYCLLLLCFLFLHTAYQYWNYLFDYSFIVYLPL